MAKNLLVILYLVSSCFLLAQNDSTPRVVMPHISPTLRFTENLGQWDSSILYRAQLDGGGLYIEKNCLTFNFYDKKKYRGLHHGGLLKGQYKDLDIKGHAYKIHFDGANTDVATEKYEPGSDYENFFIGNDEIKWKANVRNYHRVWLKNLYNDIDYEVLTTTRGIKYNFHVKAGADAGSIQLRYEGVDKNNIKLKNGVLYVKLEVTEATEQQPYAYQLINGKVKEVPCHYTLKNNVLGFGFPKGYDKHYELVIDPILVFAAQSGSTADNFGMTATYDPQGNLYSGGTVFNNGYPTTTGAYSTTFNGTYVPNSGNTDVVITKYNATGNALLFSTYIGGTGAEIVTSMVVDKNNNLCFYGATGSSNFPMVAGAYDNTFNGGTSLSFVFNGTTFNNGTDIYLGKFNSAGTSLLASTYLGGSDNDGVNLVNHLTALNLGGNPPLIVYEYFIDSLQNNYGDQYRGEIQVDNSNNIYIASSTRSSNFPTVGAFDNTLGGKQDAIIAKLNSNLSSLLYCSYIGGSSNESGNALVVKNNMEVYITGGTCSPDFPYSTGGYQSSYQGGKADGWVIRIAPTGSVVLNGTFFGSTGNDQSYFVQTDKYDDIYLYGQSSGSMPTLVAANESTVFTVPNTHQFISRLNSTLNTLNMSTVFGSNSTMPDISPAAFSVDKCNNIYISGWGGNFLLANSILSNMPLAAPTQSTTDGFDFYFMGLDSNASQLMYGSYFGGNLSQEHVDGGTSRFDPLGKIYQSVCAGCGGNDDFPVTPGAWPGTPGNPNHNTDDNNCNNGVLKLDFQLQLTISTIETNTLAGCAPFVATFTNATPSGTNSSFTWYLGNGVITTSSINPATTYTAPGTYTISLVITNSTTCNRKDSSVTYITVYPTPTVNFNVTVTPCTNSIVTNNSSTGNFGSNPYTWNFGNTATSTLTAPTYTYPANGDYTVTLTAKDINGCSAANTRTVHIFNFLPAVSTSTICNRSIGTLTASGGTSYTWSPPGSGITNTASANPAVNPTTTTIYTVTVLNSTSQHTCIGTLTTQVLVNPTPTANFNFSVNPCGGGVNFTDASANNIVDWNWKLTPVISSTVQNPYQFYQQGGTYTVQLSTTNNYGCKDSINKYLLVPTPPPIGISAGKSVCKGSSVQLSATGGTAYSWTPPQTLDYPMSNVPTATPQVNTDYSVVISTTNTANGLPCTFLLITSVSVTPLSSIPVSAQANPTFVISGSTTTLTYNGDPGWLVTWYPIGSTKPTTGYTVTAMPDRPTTYTAVASKSVCKEDAEVHVDAYSEGCLEKDVFVPNTFTPNNDGQNDIFMVRGLKINDMYFAVYNRWGEMVFETTDKTRGWDGVYKGKPADVGVFGWYLKVKCFNGEETFRKGNVTLIR